MKTTITLFTLLYSFALYAQDPALNFANTVGNSSTWNSTANASCIDGLGNIYMCGSFSKTINIGVSTFYTAPPDSTNDMLVVKYNSHGVFQWAFQIGGTGSDVLADIAIDRDGMIYIVGNISASGGSFDADPSSSTYTITPTGVSDDIFVAKFNGLLNPNSTSFFQWAFALAGSGTENPHAIAVDNDNGIYIIGSATISSSDTIDCDPSNNVSNLTGLSGLSPAHTFVIKYDGSQNSVNTSIYVWSFIVGNTSLPILGWDIAVDQDKGIYITGGMQATTSVSFDFDPSTNTNNVNGQTATSDYDIFIAKYDGSQTTINTSLFKWAFSIGGTELDRGYGITVDANKNLFVTGRLANTTADFDPSGNTGNVSTPNSNSDVFLAKYDGSQNTINTSLYKWAFAIGSSAGFSAPSTQDVGLSVACDANGGVYITGMMYVNTTTGADFDPSSNNFIILGQNSTSNHDIFIAKYDGTQTSVNTSLFKWATAIGDTGTTTDYGISVTSVGGSGVIATGIIEGRNIDFEPGAGTTYLNSSGSGTLPSLWIAKYNTSHIWTGTVDSIWSTNGNWSTGVVPTTNDDVTIPDVINDPVISTGIASCGILSIQSGGNLTITGGVLQISRSIENAGTFTASAGGTIELNGTDAQYIPSGIFTSNTIANLELNNSAGATLTDILNITDTYTPTSGILTTEGGLMLKSSANGTARIAAGSISGGYINGDVTIERYIPGKRAFRFLGHPFSSSIALSQLTDDIDITGSGGATNGFTTTTTNNPSSFWFDISTADTSTTGANPGWMPFISANTNSWDRYELLRLLIRGAKGEGLTGGTYTPSVSIFEATGAVNQGTQVISLTKGSNTTFVGCGNPFPSGVQMQNVARGSNVGANYYVWDATLGVAGAYVTNAWTLPYILPTYSAFFTTVSATDNITIEEADKDTSGAGLFKGTAPANWVELIISDSTIKWDRLLINLDDNSMDVEDNLDGKKLYNPGLDFFTFSKDDVRLAVDVRPYNDGATIPLGLTAYYRYNRYVIRTDMFEIPQGTKLYLHDKYLNKKEELNVGFEYWFNITADTNSQGNNRFEINMVGQPINGIATVKEQTAKIQLLPNPARDKVKISFEKLERETQLKLVSVTGHVAYHKEINAATGSVIVPLNNVPAGIYIVALQSNNARFTIKLVIE